MRFAGSSPDPRLPASRAALLGVLVVAAALAAGHLVAAFVGLGASPYLAVGNAAIDLTPEWLKQLAIATFGTADKVALLAGMALVLGVVAATAGLLSRGSARPGVVVILLLGAVGVAAVLSRSDLGQLGLLAPVASVLVGVGAFHRLHRRARDADTPARDADTPARGADTRRGFLTASLGVAAGAGVAGLAGQWIGARIDPEASRRAVGELVPARGAPPIPAGADFAAQGTPTFLTPNADFYRIDTALVVPRLRAQDWRMRVHGMVDRELSLSYADMRARRLVERTITLACVSNPVGGPYVSTANFIGVDLGELLEDAGVQQGAEQLLSTSEDGFTAGTPIDVVLEPDRRALLALGMNGEPLPVEHGFPVRMVVPGLYGYVSATKWLTDLQVTTWAARQGYWIPRGWAREAPIKTQSRIDAPASGARVTAGRVVVAGIAWAPHTGIRKVEVSLDGRPWQVADLAERVNVDSWRFWRAEVAAGPGEHQVRCRATDATGSTQTGEQTAVAPDGATGWHTVGFMAQ
ncbi:MAG: molybdopterin-dependent oxidoreductase [Haloechinothrix sp.]